MNKKEKGVKSTLDSSFNLVIGAAMSRPLRIGLRSTARPYGGNRGVSGHSVFSYNYCVIQTDFHCQ